jgi:hypothetical protein
MASSLLPAFQSAFAALAAEHGELMLAEQLVVYLVGGPEMRPHAVIQARLRELRSKHGAERTLAQVRELLLTYALAGARRMMAARRGGDDRCPDCAARDAVVRSVDAAVERAKNAAQGANLPESPDASGKAGG